MRNQYFHGVFFWDLGHRPWSPKDGPPKCGFFPENPNANKKSLSNAMGGHEWLSSYGWNFFSKMTSTRKKGKETPRIFTHGKPANLSRQIHTNTIKKWGNWNLFWWDSYFKTKRGWSWWFLSKNFLRFHWRDSLAHRWKRLRTRQGTWGLLLPHGGWVTEIYHSQGSILDSQVLTYQFLRFCLWHIFQAFPTHHVNILNCNFCSSTFEAAGGG